TNIAYKNSYKNEAIYFDDFVMNEVVDCVGDAKFYNVDGKPLTNEQAYTNITTTVGGSPVNTICAGNEVTATVEAYDNTSGAYTFLGWYKGNNLYSKNEEITFTAADGETYTPRFGSTNLLGSSGSFENESGSLKVSEKTTNGVYTFPSGNKWGWNAGDGYFKTVSADETVYDKTGKAYSQNTAGTFDSRTASTYEIVTTQHHTGNKSLEVNTDYGVSSMAIEGLQKNTDYTLSYYWKAYIDDKDTKKNLGGSAIVTTLNIGQKSTSTDSLLHDQLGSVVTNPNHVFNLAVAKTEEISAPATTGEWKKVTLSFNSGELSKVYLAISGFNDSGTRKVYIDDLVCRKANDDTVTTAAVEFEKVNDNTNQDTNAYGSATLESHFDGTYTATVDYDTESGAYAFKGWYYGDKEISTEETCVIDTSSCPDLSLLKAVISSANLLDSSGSFESFPKDTYLRVTTPTVNDSSFPTDNKWGYNKGDGYYGRVWNGTVYDKTGKEYAQTSSGKSIETNRFTNGSCDVKEGSVEGNTTHTGNKALFLNTSNVPSFLAIEGLEANTNYVLSFYWRHADSSTTKLRALGIVSSVNLGNDSTNTDLKINLGNKLDLGKTDSPFVIYNNIEVQSIDPSTDKNWHNAEIQFNSGELEKLYLAVSGSSSSNVQIYIDDMTLVAMPKVDVKFVDTKGEDITNKCANEAKPTITNSAKPGYLVAKVNCEVGDYDFRGWYTDADCTEFVSLDKNFEFVNGTYSTLTAKVVSRNILSSTASFEDYNVDEKQYKVSYTDASKKPDYPSGNLWGSNANGGYYGATNEGETIYDKYGTAYTQSQGGSRNTNAITNAKVSTEQKHNGDKSLRIDFNWRAASLGIDVTPNTDYTLSYYWYTAADQSIFEKVKQNQLKTAVVTTLNVGSYSAATATDGSGSTITGALANLLGAESPIALGTATSEARTTSGGEWERVDISFNSGNLEKVYLVVASSIDNSTALSGIWIDDLTCYAENLTGDDLGITNITEYKASNMRSGSDTVKQALRHKFEIEKTLIDGGNDLYGEVVEYGSIAVPTSYLNGTELDKNGKYNGKVPAIGTAYNKDKGTNIKFAENDTTITFTAALTGIGKNGNYATAYARSYTVRNYIIFRDRNTNKETVVYGAKTEASVFGIMAAILDKYNKNIENPDDQLKADYNTVKGILNSDGYVKTAFLELYQDYSDLLD
ncbi:MAG: hypothetical protein U0L55_01455, partial [Acutalibacteraceae bacterium]|nr:hypothetical protein [Acutalibacteraceae bacterium]